MVRDKKKVRFFFYREENLYYKTECGFVFKVPIADTGNGTFGAEESALQMMRWLRPAIDEVNKEEEDLIQLSEEIQKEVKEDLKNMIEPSE